MNKRCCLAFLFLFVLAAAHASPAIKEEKSILHLNSYSIHYRWSHELTQGIADVFKGEPNVHIAVEFMNTKTFNSPSYLYRLYSLYKFKYAETDFDAIVISDNNAFEFYLKYGASLFPNVPVVFCGISNLVDYTFDSSRIIGIGEQADAEETLDRVFNLLPSTNNLVIIADETLTSEVVVKSYQRIYPKYKSRAHFTFVRDIRLPDLYDYVDKLNPNEVIVLIGLHKDHKGRPLIYEDVAVKIAKRSPVPVFCDADIGDNQNYILAGLHNPGYRQGKEAGKLAYQILTGKSLSELPALTMPKNIYKYDFMAMNHFGLDINKLPENAIVTNRPESIYSQYSKELTFFALMVLFLIYIIVHLTRSNKQKAKAKEVIETQFHEIQTQNEEIEASLEQLREANVGLVSLNEKMERKNRELIEAKEKAEQSDKLKTAFLTNISHDVRTPLNAIIGFTTILRDEFQNNSVAKEYMQHIYDGGQSLLTLICDILDVSKIESGHMPISNRVTKLNELLDFILTTVRQKAESQKRGNVEIELKKGKEDPDFTVLTDSRHLRQILNKLLDNALKYTVKGNINFGYKINANNELLFFVEDTGQGIPEGKINLAFEPFAKIPQEGHDLSDGAGLGLTIVKSLVELMGGHVWIESEANKGTSLFFTLPLKTTAKNPGQSEEIHSWNQPDQHYDWSGRKILIAEDVESNFRYIEACLRNTNITIVWAQNGQKALDIYKEEKDIDLALVDIQMPKVDGYTVCRKLKKLNDQLPIIAQTANATTDDRQKCLKAGFDNYLSKPINKHVLMVILDSFL